MQNILLIQTGFIGDVVLSTPCIAVIKEIYPDSKISFLTTPVAKDLLLGNPFLEEILIYDKRNKESGLRGIFKLAKLLKSKKYDKIFSLHKSYRTSLLVFLSRVTERFGFKESKLSFLYTHTSKRSHYQHEVQRNLAIFETLGFDPISKSIPLSLYFDDTFLEENKLLISELPDKFIAVCPSSVWATKQWTVEGFSQVIKYYLEKGIGVVLLGSRSEKNRANDIKKYIDSNKLFKDLTGDLSLRQSALVISKADIVLCNDSSPLHISCSVNTPVVSVFCATVPEQGFYPWMVENRIVEVKNLECRPCGRHGQMTCPLNTNACQIGISPNEVISAIESLLKTKL